MPVIARRFKSGERLPKRVAGQACGVMAISAAPAAMPSAILRAAQPADAEAPGKFAAMLNPAVLARSIAGEDGVAMLARAHRPLLRKAACRTESAFESRPPDQDSILTPPVHSANFIEDNSTPLTPQ